LLFNVKDFQNNFARDFIMIGQENVEIGSKQIIGDDEIEGRNFVLVTAEKALIKISTFFQKKIRKNEKNMLKNFFTTSM